MLYNQVLAVLVLLFATCASSSAQDFSITPRLSTGVLIYNFELDNTYALISPSPGDLQQSGFQGFDVNDTLPYVGGGLAAAYKRFFVDISGLVTPKDGSADVSSQTASINNFRIIGGIGNGVLATQGGKADFDRAEMTALFGYDVTDSLRIFTGVKYAETTFNIRASETFNVNAIIFDPVLGEVPARGFVAGRANNKSKFVQKGPFIGAGYSIPVDSLNGKVLINSAISYLYGDIHQKWGHEFGLASIEAFPPNRPPLRASAPFPEFSGNSSLDGTSIGINTGLGWSGSVPATNIGYLIGADGSFYDFEADHSDSDFREISWRIRAEVSYRF